MHHFKIVYKSGEHSDSSEETSVVAASESKALKAFHIKVSGVKDEDVLSISQITARERKSGVSSGGAVNVGKDIDQYSGEVKTTTPIAGFDRNPTEKSNVLGILGVISLVIGGFLLFDPTIGQDSDVANLHMLSVGQTLSIVGSIFVGIQWRPR